MFWVVGGTDPLVVVGVILDVEVTLGRETLSGGPGRVTVVVAVNEAGLGPCPEVGVREVVSGVDHIDSSVATGGLNGIGGVGPETDPVTGGVGPLA